MPELPICWRCEQPTEHPIATTPENGATARDRYVLLCDDCFLAWACGDFTLEVGPEPEQQKAPAPRQLTMFEFISGETP